MADFLVKTKSENLVETRNYCSLSGNQDARILTATLEIAVLCACAVQNLAKNNVERLARRRVASSCNASQTRDCHLCNSLQHCLQWSRPLTVADEQISAVIDG